MIILVSAAALSSCIRISHTEPCQTGMDGDILPRCDSVINTGIALKKIPHGLEQYGRTAGWDSSSSSSYFIGKLREGGKSICHTGYTGTSIVLDFNRHIAIILTNRVHPEDKGSIGDIRRAVSDIVSDGLGG